MSHLLPRSCSLMVFASLAISAEATRVPWRLDRCSSTDTARRWREVVAEGVLALLLVCSGMVLNGFPRLQRADPGFDSHNALTVRIGRPAIRYSQQTQVGPLSR